MWLSSDLQARAAVVRANTHLVERPDRLPRALAALAPWGVNLAGTVAASAARYPKAVAVVDEDGATTYRQLWRRSLALAGGLRALEAGPGSRVGVLSRNRVGFVESTIAVVASGADVVLLNPSFAGPQLAGVVADEGIDLLLHDDDLTAVAAASGVRCVDEGEAAILAADRSHPGRATRRPGRIVVLTSGTTGRPRGASRRPSGGVVGAGALLGRIPLRPGDRTVVAAPMFHAWGLAHMVLGLFNGSRLLLRRRFDPAETVADAAAHRATVLVVVPVMLQRMLALGGEALVPFDLSALRIIACSGSALPGPVATEAMRRFGPVVYSVFGSTEVATATVASPSDLQVAPTTVGRAAPGVRVAVLDGEGRAVPSGEVGTIYVQNPLAFEGYSDGGDKPRVGGLVSTGDLGHVDASGRFFVDGRADDMIVSGGENVFPGEVEDLLAGHPAIAEVAVVGVTDDEFTQALAAFVVPKPDATIDAEAVRLHVAEHLARFKVPRTVTFVDTLPRNAAGKVLKAELR